MAYPDDAKKMVKSVGYTELSERVLSETSLAKYVSGVIGEGDVTEGQQLKVYVHGLSTIQNYVAGTGVDIKGDGSDYVTVNNLQDIAVNEILDGLSVKQAYNEADYVAARLEAAAEAIGDRVDTDYFTKLGAGGTAAVTTAVTASTIVANILTLKKALDEAGAPEFDRFLILSPETENMLLSVSSVVLNTKKGEEILYGGYIGDIYGFKVLRSTRLPLNANGYVTMVAMHSRGAIYADGWKVEPTIMELNDANHIGDSKIAGRYVYNPGVIRATLVQLAKQATVAITLNLDGGNYGGVTDNHIFYHPSGALLATPPVPVKTGKVFDGWKDASEAAVTFSSNGPKPAANTTYKATWADA